MLLCGIWWSSLLHIMLVKPCAVYCAVQGILSSVGRVFKDGETGHVRTCCARKLTYPWHTYSRMNALVLTYIHIHSHTLTYMHTITYSHAYNFTVSVYYKCCNWLYCVLEGFCFCYIYHLTIVKCTCDTLLFKSITVLWLVHVIQVLWCDWFMLRRYCVLIGSCNFLWLVNIIGRWSLFRIVLHIVWTFQASIIFKKSPPQTLKLLCRTTKR